MGSYDKPKAYFGMTDRTAARNSNLSHKSAASNFKNYMTQKSNSIRAVRASKDKEIEGKQNNFYAQYQGAFNELSALESALSGNLNVDMSDESSQSAMEITDFKNQIQMQLEKIAGDLTNEISGKKGRDMSEASIQALIGNSVGRVQKLQSTISNLLAAAEEYYNAPEGSIISSSNPELQLLFDGLRDDKIDLVFGEDGNEEWSVYPVSQHDSRGNAIDWDDAKWNTDGKPGLSKEERYAAAKEWAEDENNTLYRGIPGTSDFEYNYIKDIGPLNLSQLERDFTNGTGAMQGNKDGNYFNTVGNYKELKTAYDTQFKTFLENNRQALQKIEPSGEGDSQGVKVKKQKSKTGTATGKNANTSGLTNQDQEYYNPYQVKGLLNSEAGKDFLNMFTNSETLESDYAGWLGEEFDLLSEDYNSKGKIQDALKEQLIQHSLLNLPGGQPIKDNKKLITEEDEEGGYVPREIVETD